MYRHRCKTPSDMLTGQPKRACLCREVHGQRGDGRNRKLRWETSRMPKQRTRSTIEVMLKPFARAKNDVDANQSSWALKVTQQTRQRGSSFQQQYHMNSGTGQSRKPRAASEQFDIENVAHGATDSRKQREVPVALTSTGVKKSRKERTHRRVRTWQIQHDDSRQKQPDASAANKVQISSLAPRLWRTRSRIPPCRT